MQTRGNNEDERGAGPSRLRNSTTADDEEDEDYQTPVRLPFSTTNVENVVIKLVPSIL